MVIRKGGVLVIARKKLIILILSVAIIIIIALVAVVFCIKSDNSTTPDDLITYNNFNNLSKNHDTFFIEVTDLYENKDTLYIENTPEAILYLDSNCQQVFSTETHIPSLLLSKETVSENLDLYMVVSQKTPIFPIID